MPAMVPIDKAGRIVLPKAIREQMGLGAGDSLVLEANGETLTMKPHRPANRLQREMGVWVFRCGEPVTQAETDEVLRKMREDRRRP